MSEPRRNSRGQFGKARPAPPDLEFRAPDCSLCGNETDCDGDSFVCHGCEAWWTMRGDKGKWHDGDALACPSVIEWFNTDRLNAEHESIRHLTDSCVLPDDHAGKHRCADSWREWADDDPRIVSKAAAS